MTANVDVLLARLEGVRPSGKDSWTARCPAHKDRSASLSIGMGADGRILLHDFAGCCATDIVQAVGLTLADLFPERIRSDDSPEERRRRRMAARQHQWASALPVLEFESRVVLIVANDLRAGKAPSAEDLQRLDVAVERIEAIREHFNPADVRKILRELAEQFVANGPTPAREARAAAEEGVPA